MEKIRKRTGRLILSVIAASGAMAQGNAVFAQMHPGVRLLPPVAAQVRPGESSPAPGGISLDQAIAAVLVADPKLHVGYEEINQAMGDAVTASLRPNPTFSTDGQLLPLNRPFTVQQQGGPPQFDALVSYPIDWFLFGKRKAAMAATAIGVRQTESEYYDLVRQRIRDASSLYFDVVELKALGDLARQDVESLARVEAITRRAAENGARSAVDAQRVRLDLLASQQVYRNAEAALASAKAKLRAYLGRTDSDLSFDVSGSLNQPTPNVPLSAEEAVAIAQENRPDLAALRFKLAKAEADTVVQHRKAFPEVAARAGYSRQFQGSIGFRDADTYLVGIDVGLPIFDRNQGNRAKAASQVAQSQYELQLSAVQLRAEIEQALIEFRSAQQSANAVASEQLKLAEQVRNSINKANEAGGRPLLDVLDAQRNYRETYRLFISSRANYWRAGIRLNAALGKRIVP